MSAVRGLPRDITAEAVMLGCALQATDAVEARYVLGLLPSAGFYSEGHRLIHDVLQKQAETGLHWGTYEKSIRRTLEGLKDRAREEASTPRALMMAAWTWWWTNPEGWHRTALHGARGYRAFFQHAHVKHYLDRMRDEAATAPASPAAAPPKPKSPGEVAWDRWMEGLDAARAWYAANKGTREGDAFHAAMEAACKPNPIAELFGGYMDNPKERRIVREVFVSEYERRTAPLRLVAR